MNCEGQCGRWQCWSLLQPINVRVNCYDERQHWSSDRLSRLSQPNERLSSAGCAQRFEQISLRCRRHARCDWHDSALWLCCAGVCVCAVCAAAVCCMLALHAWPVSRGERCFCCILLVLQRSAQPSSLCCAPRAATPLVGPWQGSQAVYRTPYIRPWLPAASPVCTSHTRGLLPSRNRAEPLCSVCVCVMELERARSIHLLQLSSCHSTIATLTEPTAASRE